MKKLRTYASKRFGMLSDYLKSYQRTQDPELLHQIRIEIKKIKVVLNLMDFSIDKFKGHQHFIPIRTVFRRAGEIRELDVFYRLLLRYQIAGVADSQIPNADKIYVMSAAFQKDVPLFLKLIKTEKKKLLMYYLSVNKTNAQHYLKKKRKALNQLLFPRLTKANLHKARKMAKEMLYLKWVDGHRKANAFYKEVDSMIGQWHDKQLLLSVLQTSNATDEVARLRQLSKVDLVNLKNKVAKYYDS